MRDEETVVVEVDGDEAAREAAMAEAEGLARSSGVECAVYRDAQGHYRAGTQADVDALPPVAAWWVASVRVLDGGDGVARPCWEGGMTF